MSDVRIENVGGPRPSAGVASEATLQELVRVLNRSGQSSTASRLQDRYQRDYNRETENTTKAKGKLRQAATDLTKEFVSGGDRLSDFSEHILKTNGILQRLIRFSDGLVDQFREFSSVGASFNNNIFDMRTSALQAAMNLDSFQQLVMNNSDTLRLFGSSVTDGAKRFTQLSRQFRTINPQFFDMGFTIEDINEGLMTYTELLARTGRVEQINSRDMLDGSAAYMKQLDMLAKVTGQSREALARQSEDINNDARMRAIVARAGGENADALAQNAATIMAFAPGLRDSFLNLMDGGVALDEISQMLETSAGPAGQALAELMRDARDLEPDEFAKRFAELGPDVAQFINSNLSRELVALHPEFRAFADAIAPMASLSEASIEAVRKEQAQTETVTSTLANFSQTIQELRSFIVDEIIESEAFSALGRLGETFSNLVSPSAEGSVPNFQDTLTRAINGLVGEDGIITQAINWVNDLIQTDDFQVRLTEFVDTLTKMTGRIVDFFLGKEINIGGDDPTEVIMQRQGGLFSNMYTMFEDLFSEEREGNFGSRVMSIIVDGFKGIFNTLGTTIVEAFEMEGEEGESPWQAISSSVQEAILNWLEGDTVVDTNNFWNRAWTAVGGRILGWLGVEPEDQTGNFWSDVWTRISTVTLDWLGVEPEDQTGNFWSDVWNRISTVTLGWLGVEPEDQTGNFWSDVWNRISTVTLGWLGVEPEDQTGNFWSDVWNRISTVTLDWLESDVTVATSDFWNRAWTAVGDRILNLLSIERSVDELEIDTPSGIQAVEVPATFWQTIYDTILERLGLDQQESDTTSLIERIGNKLSEGWENLLEGPAGQRIIDSIQNLFEEILDNLLIALADIIPGFSAVAAKTRQLERNIASGQELTAEQEELRQELLRQAERDVSRAEIRIERTDARIANAGPGADQSIVERWQTQATEYQATIAAAEQLIARLTPRSEIAPEPLPERRIGTLQATGMRAEPRDTVAQIHQGERVLNPQETQEYNNQSGNNQRDLLQKLDQLNNTMMTVASLINQELSIQTRTMNSIGGLGPDLMKGMPG
jgi:hypothetical protein